MSMKSFWDIRKDTDILLLMETLIWNGKFYGAEWVDYNSFSELDGILAPYIDHYIDPVETIRQIRDPPEYPDDD